MQQPDKIIILSAPSGAGKTTIVKEMMKRIPNLSFSISATTRLPRGAEQNGVEYYFLSREEFEHRIENNEFVEWNENFPGRLYGTLKVEMDRMANEHKIPVFDVDVVGGSKIKEEFGEHALFIFIKAPMITIEERLKARKTDDENSIKDRIERIPFELSFADKADVIIENIELNKAFDDCQKVIEKFLNE